MPSCSECGYENIDDTTTCAVCGAVTVASEPEFCGGCENPLPPHASYCASCGGLFVEKMCAEHEYRPAVGVCVICYKPLCEDCIAEKNGVYFCDDDAHEVSEEFVVLTTTGHEYEAQMLKDILKNADIDVQILSFKASAFMMTIGEQSDIKIMVPESQLREAEEILENLGNQNSTFFG